MLSQVPLELYSNIKLTKIDIMLNNSKYVCLYII